MAGCVVPRQTGVSALVLVGRVMLVLAVAVPQVVLGLVGYGDESMKLAIWGLLAMVLAGVGALVLAAVWAEVSALLLAVGRLGAVCLGLWRRIRGRAGDLPAGELLVVRR